MCYTTLDDIVRKKSIVVMQKITDNITKIYKHEYDPLGNDDADEEDDILAEVGVALLDVDIGTKTPDKSKEPVLKRGIGLDGGGGG